MLLIYEAGAVGIVVVLVGVVVSGIVGMFHKQTKSVCKDWNKNHVMELTLFLIGVFSHLLFEFLGFNRWYCKNGHACKSK
jgi:hypothetical protein